jgi:hypothetical protein
MGEQIKNYLKKSNKFFLKTEKHNVFLLVNSLDASGVDHEPHQGLKRLG